MSVIYLFVYLCEETSAYVKVCYMSFVFVGQKLKFWSANNIRFTIRSIYFVLV